MSQSPQRGRRAERIAAAAPVATPEDSIITPPRSVLNSPGMDRVSAAMRNTSVPSRAVESNNHSDRARELSSRSQSEPRYKHAQNGNRHASDSNYQSQSGNTYSNSQNNGRSNSYQPKFNPSHRPPPSPSRPGPRYPQKTNGYNSRSEEMLDTYGQDDYRPSDYYNNSKPAMYNSGDYRGRSHDSLPTNKQAAHSRSATTIPAHHGIFDDDLGGTRRPLSFVKALEMSEMARKNSNVVTKQNHALPKSQSMPPHKTRQSSSSRTPSSSSTNDTKQSHPSHKRPNDKKKNAYDTFEVAV